MPDGVGLMFGPPPVRHVSARDRLYLKAYGKYVLCERRRPAEDRELRRRRLADGSYPVPVQIDEFAARPFLDRRPL